MSIKYLPLPAPLSGVYTEDCLTTMRQIPDNSVDSIATDPPWGIKFMGKRWDYSVPSVEMFAEMLRILKPGGYIACACGTRTQHRMAVNIEDAGFEIRDMILWVYATGFPKSHDISKAIDREAGAEREVVGELQSVPDHNISGTGAIFRNKEEKQGARKMVPQTTAPATPEAAQWQGWGTALKPSFEIFTLARKPFKGTVAANVLKHGTGGLNIDGCRIGAEEITTGGAAINTASYSDYKGIAPSTHTGRWPANLLHDGSEEVTGLFPETTSGARKGENKTHSLDGTIYGKYAYTGGPCEGSTGSASRFFHCAPIDEKDNVKLFYTAKADKKERAGSRHPTVKPLSLMRWIVRLITPPGGTVFDGFVGSGTTAEAAAAEGFSFIVCEKNPANLPVILKRIERGNTTREQELKEQLQEKGLKEARTPEEIRTAGGQVSLFDAGA